MQDRVQVFFGTVSPFVDARLLSRACGRFLEPVGFLTFSSRHFRLRERSSPVTLGTTALCVTDG